MADLGFTGGSQMSSRLRELMQELGVGHTARVGFLEGSTCGKHNDASAPQIAFIQEFGAPAKGIPARPFFRDMIAVRSPQWGALLQAALKHRGFNSEEAMELTGMRISEQLQQSIEEFTEPGNAPSTIKQKGFDKPLEDSKNMKRAASFQVIPYGSGE